MSAARVGVCHSTEMALGSAVIISRLINLYVNVGPVETKLGMDDAGGFAEVPEPLDRDSHWHTAAITHHRSIMMHDDPVAASGLQELIDSHHASTLSATCTAAQTDYFSLRQQTAQLASEVPQ
jgi:hypothetical protein